VPRGLWSAPKTGANHPSSFRPDRTAFGLRRYPPNLTWRHQSWSRATAALELAVAAPLLLVMVSGAADLGLAQFYRANLANAVAAGAQYAFLTGTSVSTTNIQTVIQNAMFMPAGASSNLSVSFIGSSPGVQGRGRYCVAGTSPSATASSKGATCPDGSSVGYYIWFKAPTSARDCSAESCPTSTARYRNRLP
jgi:hypothetical protein